MAHLPGPRAAALTPGGADARSATGPLRVAPDAAARAVLARLAAHGHEAAIVGGSLRDVLRGARPVDWDVATSAPPEAVHALFPGSTWENRFGTVTVHGAPPVQITTYRSESGYSDRRRPDAVRWGTSLAEDLARRDFTVNALAWLPDAGRTPNAGAQPGMLHDPFGGQRDLADGILRAVGDPDRRFAEDALRLLRAVRFATRLGLRIESATELAIRRRAPSVAVLSGERVRDELRAWLGVAAAPPSRPFLLAEELGLLAFVLPELAALRGVPQAKALPGDALDHSLRTADALPAEPATLRWAGLLHDIGKANTLADGHFHGHEAVGSKLAGVALERLRFPRVEAEAIAWLIRHHMFAYDPSWTDAAVRRFVRRVGRGALPALFALRRADDAASGALQSGPGGIDGLAARIDTQAAAPLEARALAIDGHDLMDALGIGPGPALGALLDALLEIVLDDPARNERTTLLAAAREVQAARALRPRTAG